MANRSGLKLTSTLVSASAITRCQDVRRQAVCHDAQHNRPGNRSENRIIAGQMLRRDHHRKYDAGKTSGATKTAPHSTQSGVE